ncbi:hypothetical protein [Kordia sp.]|uniref:hypothetical protein n=1 Tax=Kordia sp. TaxID=1965332 RepID=UPI003D6BDB0F
MKKKNLKSLSLNKKSISNLESYANIGGASTAPIPTIPPTVSDGPNCYTIWRYTTCCGYTDYSECYCTDPTECTR